MKRLVFTVMAAVLVLAACSQSANIKPPHELVEFTPQATVTRLWKTSVGDGAGDSGIRMRPAYSDGVVYAAAIDGTIAAFDATNGDTVWRKHSRTHGWFGWGDSDRKDAFYSGGPAVANGLLVIGTKDGHVYGLSASDGSQRWVATVSAGVLSTPAIAGNRVVVRTNDGKVTCLNAADGSTEWVYDQGIVPLLSLRGNGDVLVTNGVVFFGSDDGKLVALRLETGDKLWAMPLASGEGSTDIERMDDADGAILIHGHTLYAAAYHGNVVAVDGPSARRLWEDGLSTYASMAVDDHMLVAVDSASNVWAFDPATGSNLWKQDKLAWRWLSGPAIQDGYAVVGDLEGYLHWLSPSDGHFVARKRLSHDAIRAQPLVVDNVAYVMDVAGHLAAYTITAGKP